MQEMQVQSLVWEDPLEKEMATHSNILAWRAQWSLVCYSPWGRKELDMAERLSTQKVQVQGLLFPLPLVQTASPGTNPRQSRLQKRGSRTRGSATASGFR